MDMDEHTGWLLDVYASIGGGLVLWLLADTGERLRLWMDFPVTFYAAGEFELLRHAWRFLQDKRVKLDRVRRQDLFTGDLDVLAITVPNPVEVPRTFYTLSNQFPSLDYYDADIPITLRFISQTGVHLLGRCRIAHENEIVSDIRNLDSPWDLEPVPLPLRTLYLSPDTDPAIRSPGWLHIRYERTSYALNLEPVRPLVIHLQGILRRFDPDLIISDYGDTWLFPWLRKVWPDFNPNRDTSRETLVRKADSYFAYGQVIYRGTQTHLFGRWHVDRKNALLFGEVGLEGVLELARVSGIGVQEAARKSPGAGITAMQMLTALRSDVLVPVVKQQAEKRKSLEELIRVDKGGLIYQPIVGIHQYVAQIDFASMYPSIMVNYNISPETKGADDERDGLVPRTLRSLVEKRLKLKNILLELDPRDCRVKVLKERTSALKWLLVVCFGYLGYKNARFGRIEAHEAVTAISREVMMQAKEVAEAMGFTVLHMYVDSLFVQKDGLQKQEDFRPLLEAVHVQTGIPITLEGVYKWLVFPPSKVDKRVPVPNRYFGAFLNGEVKARGIALRQHDTCFFVSKTQQEILKILACGERPAEMLPAARAFVQRQLRRLEEGQVPLPDLLIAKKLSRELKDYKVPGPAAQAARQIQERGGDVRAGLRVRFWFVHGGVKVREVKAQEIAVKKYRRLLTLAVDEVLSNWENSERGSQQHQLPLFHSTMTSQGG